MRLGRPFTSGNGKPSGELDNVLSTFLALLITSALIAEQSLNSSDSEIAHAIKLMYGHSCSPGEVKTAAHTARRQEIATLDGRRVMLVAAFGPCLTAAQIRLGLLFGMSLIRRRSWHRMERTSAWSRRKIYFRVFG